MRTIFNAEFWRTTLATTLGTVLAGMVAVGAAKVVGWDAVTWRQLGRGAGVAVLSLSFLVLLVNGSFWWSFLFQEWDQFGYPFTKKSRENHDSDLKLKWYLEHLPPRRSRKLRESLEDGRRSVQEAEQRFQEANQRLEGATRRLDQARRLRDESTALLSQLLALQREAEALREEEASVPADGQGDVGED